MHWAVVQLEDDTPANALPPYTQSWFWRLVLPAAFTVACLVLGILYATIAPNKARHFCLLILLVKITAVQTSQQEARDAVLLAQHRTCLAVHTGQ